MISPREDISAALFKLLQGATYPVTINKFSRRYISSADLSSGNMPAVCMLVHNEHADYTMHGLAAKWKLEVYIFIFIETVNPDVEPEATLNTIIDAIDQALTVTTKSINTMNNRQTLGGLVYDCRISGTVERDPGFQSGVGAAAIPIEILTTN